MTEVLSQDEIDQLLTAISSGDAETDDTRQVAERKNIRIWDFRRPDKFSKEQIRTVSFMHETFARLTTTSLAAQLRSMVHVHVASVDQLTYEEFLAAAPSLYKTLPKGWKVRVTKLEKDLDEKPEGGVATIMSDEFFNVYDKTGPGMSNYKP